MRSRLSRLAAIAASIVTLVVGVSAHAQAFDISRAITTTAGSSCYDQDADLPAGTCFYFGAIQGIDLASHEGMVTAWWWSSVPSNTYADGRMLTSFATGPLQMSSADGSFQWTVMDAYPYLYDHDFQPELGKSLATMHIAYGTFEYSRCISIPGDAGGESCGESVSSITSVSTSTTTPEPATLALAACGLLLLGGVARRNVRRASTEAASGFITGA
jgi:hypothetical protein